MRCALVRVSLILFVTVTFPGHATAQALDEFRACLFSKFIRDV